MTLEKFTTRDLILLGVFNATVLLFYYGALLVLHLLPVFWGAMDPIVNFFLTPIFFLMLVQVPKAGAMTVHGLIMGLVHAATGWWPGFFAALAAGLLADGLSLCMGGYTRRPAICLAVLLYTTLKAVLFYAPLYLLTYIPWFNKVVSIWPQELLGRYTTLYALAFLIANAVTCSLGLLAGNRLLGKHFKNARVCRP